MVSVIIPVYNVEEYLRQCVDSVLNQTYKDLEIILVDDGSPDHCGAICDEYATRDNRIKVIHKPNGGLSDARNAGLNVATGEYVLFVDGDDYIASSLVETVASVMNQGKDLVAFRFCRVRQDGSITEGDPFIAENWDLETPEERSKFYAKVLLQYKIGWEACTRMFRRDMIEKLNLRFEDNRRIFAEDLCFSICYCLEAQQIACVENSLYYYRFRDDSIMGQESVRLNAGRMNELSKSVYDFFCRQKAPVEMMTVFPLIHFYVIHISVSGYKKLKGIRQGRLRKLMLKEIDDRGYFTSMLKQLNECQSRLEEYYGKCKALHILKVADYWRTGNFLKFFARTIAVRRLRRGENG